MNSAASGEATVEAFDVNGLSLGAVPIGQSGFSVNISNLFGNQLTSSFRVQAIEGFRPSSLTFAIPTVSPIFAASALGGSPFAQFTQFVQLVQIGADTQVRIDADGNGAGTNFVTLATLQNVAVGAIGSQNFVIA